MDADALIGSVVGGRYRVTRKLGEGGMGAVYVAVQEPLGRDVALKVMKWTLTGKVALAERFQREAKTLARLAHPNIVTLHDFGVDEAPAIVGVGGAGMLYLAMELLPGETLGERIRREGAIAPAKTVPIVRDIASGLSVAHAAGLVHRDLKPENVMLVHTAGRGTLAKILDFGIAKATDEGERLTNTGIVVGTPGYMAPELAVYGVTDDPRLDFYALGVIWFEMLTGRAVFDAATPIALVMRHAREAPPTPSTAAPTAGISPEIDALVMKLLAKNPDDRPKDADALIAMLDAIKDAGGDVLLAPPPTGPGVSNAATMVPATTFRPFPTTTPPTSTGLGPLQATETSLDVTAPPKGPPLPIAAIVAAIVVVIVVAIAIIMRTPPAPLPPPPTPPPSPSPVIVPPPAPVATPSPTPAPPEPTPHATPKTTPHPHVVHEKPATPTESPKKPVDEKTPDIMQ